MMSLFTEKRIEVYEVLEVSIGLIINEFVKELSVKIKNEFTKAISQVISVCALEYATETAESQKKSTLLKTGPEFNDLSKCLAYSRRNPDFEINTNRITVLFY